MTPLAFSVVALAAIVCYRIFVDIHETPDPRDRARRLATAKRIVSAVVVALLFAAVLRADDGAATDIIIRCQKMWCWPWY